MSSTMFKFVVILVIFQLAYIINCSPLQYQDSEAAASHDDHHHHGRVQIKVFRGPSEGHGHGHEHFAPWGYWVKQPADADHHH